MRIQDLVPLFQRFINYSDIIILEQLLYEKNI